MAASDRMEFRHGRPTDLDCLLLELRDLGIDLKLSRGKLRSDPASLALTPDLSTRLTERREDIARALRGPEYHVHGAVPSAPFLYHYRDLFRKIRRGELGVGFTNSPHWVVRFTGFLDTAALVAAIRHLVARHPILGARVELRDEVPVFVYSDEVYVHVSDEWHSDGAAGAQQAQASIDGLVWREFDLDRETLFRPFILNVAAQTHVIGFVIHHLIGDAVSVSVVAQDLYRSFVACVTGRGALPVANSLQYSDYLLAMHDWLIGTGLRYRLDHWMRQLRGVRSCCLPADFEVPAGEGGFVRTQTREIAPAVAARVRELADGWGTTSFTIFLAVYYCALRHALRSSDLVLLVMHHGRDHPGLATVVGSFQNQVPLRIAAPRELRFSDLVARVHEHCTGAYERLVPYGNILHEFERSATPHVFPEFNFLSLTALAHGAGQDEPSPLEPQPTTAPSIRTLAGRHPFHVFDVTVSAECVKLKCTYLDVFYRPDTITRHLEVFASIAGRSARNPLLTVCELCEAGQG